MLVSVAAVASGTYAQCGAISFGAPIPIAANGLSHSRSDGPAQYVIPTIVHVYYSDWTLPVSTNRIVDMIEQANLILRSQYIDTAGVCSAFQDIIGDLSVELRLAHLDTAGNCTSGIEYIHWSGIGVIPDIASHTQNTARYLNIHVYPQQISQSIIPSPGQPLPGDIWDNIVMSSWDVDSRPWILAHEVGHWVGLYHTFGNTNTSAVTCGDDGVLDTPITAGSAVGTCDTTLSVCTPGIIENVQNAMDYSTCENMFTIGQAERVAAVMTDTTIARYMHFTEENLAFTGVDIPSTCPLVADFSTVTMPHCGYAVVRNFAFATGQIPDQVSWSFPGGSPATSTEYEPDITYTTSGTYIAQLIACYGTECDTMEHSYVISITGLQDNGLAVATMPWSEGFENGFAFPEPNMGVIDNGTPNWQPCDFAGYNSGNSLHIPEETLAFVTNDTNDLIIGNFDFTGMSSPGISFKVAATYYTGVQYYYFHLMMGDLCDQSLASQSWMIYLQPDLAGLNTNSGFVPNTPEQWTTLTFSSPSWSYFPNAEVKLRVVKPWMGGVVDEGIWIDDITIGEADMILGMPAAVQEEALQVFPDPASDHITIITGSMDAHAILRSVDMQGSELYRGRAQGRMDLDVSTYPAVTYAIRVVDEKEVRRARMVVQH